MMEFLLDHPYLIILLLVWLGNLLFGKKKGPEAEAAKKAQAQQAQAKRARQDARRQQPAGGEQPVAKQQGAKEQYRSRIEEALRNAMQEADLFDSRTPAAESPAENPRPSKAIGAAAPSDGDPFAFRSLMSAGEKGRVDYDKTAVDYDQTAIDYDKRPNAFAFREAIAEPVEKEYHLTGFSGFHSAHALSAEDRRRAAGADAYESSGAGPAFSIGNRDDLRRAIIIQEVLGKPKALRGKSEI